MTAALSPNRLVTSTRNCLLAGALLHLITEQCFAQGLDANQIKLIQETAASICDTVKVARGSKTDVELRGEVDAKLKGLASKLAGAGVAGQVTFKESSFEGLSQEATAAAQLGDRECRERIFNKMFEKIESPKVKATDGAAVARDAVLGTWAKAKSARGRVPSVTQYSADPVFWAGNLPMLVREMADVAAAINPIHPAGGFLVGADAKLSDGEYRYMSQQMLRVKEDLESRKNRLEQLMGTQVDALTAEQFANVLDELSRPWFVPFIALRITGTEGYWKNYSRFSCAIIQYEDFNYDFSHARRPAPDCTTLGGSGVDNDRDGEIARVNANAYRAFQSNLRQLPMQERALNFIELFQLQNGQR